MMTKTHTEMIESQKHFLEDVNKDLSEMIRIASMDFVAVNTLLKDYYSKDKFIPAELGIKIEVMMSGLQYMDIFNQRVEHLIYTHERMITTSLAFNFRESLFHLHVFQSLTIELDLLRSIASIKSILFDLNQNRSENGMESWNMEGFFVHTATIKSILQNTISVLAQAGGDTQYLPIPPLSPEQIRILNSLYTMESERVVLAWFLYAMPSGTWEDLLQYYEKEINQIEKDSTELF